MRVPLGMSLYEVLKDIGAQLEQRQSTEKETVWCRLGTTTDAKGTGKAYKPDLGGHSLLGAGLKKIYTSSALTCFPSSFLE